MKEKLYSPGLLLVLMSMILLNVNSIFYPKIIEDTYQKCGNWCIKDGKTFPCDCKEITDEKSTTPLLYLITFIILIIIGLIMMATGWIYKNET